MSEERWFVIDPVWHNNVVRACYLKRGFKPDETEDAVKLCESAARNGIRTHNALKALHLDELFGSTIGGCIPGAEIRKFKSRFGASEVWNGNRKLGPSVAYPAMDRAVELAEKFGIGMVSVDNAFHYIWGGAYALEAAARGFIGYTNCTSLLAEVAPHGGRTPALGTNPHTWAFPTQSALGFPVLIDWATSAISMGRVQQLTREGRPLPEGVAIDAKGEITTNPAEVAGLLPFGGHKGYGLGLINELFAATIGGFKPTLRGKPSADGEKTCSCFYFMAIHPEALAGDSYSSGRSMDENLRLVIENIIGAPGNENARIPGAKSARWRQQCATAGGLLLTRSEIDAFNQLAQEAGVPRLSAPLREFIPQ